MGKQTREVKEPQYAELVRTLRAQMAYVGRTQTETSLLCGLGKDTLGTQMREPGTIRLGTLRALVGLLKPNPEVMLRALGYDSKDIMWIKKGL